MIRPNQSTAGFILGTLKTKGNVFAQETYFPCVDLHAIYKRLFQVLILHPYHRENCVQRKVEGHFLTLEADYKMTSLWKCKAVCT